MFKNSFPAFMPPVSTSMNDEQSDISSMLPIFYIIGIGTEGCQAIRHIQDKGKYEYLTLVAIHSDAGTLAKSGADKTVLLEIDKLMFDESGSPAKSTREYLTSNLAEQIKKGDAFFILAGYGDQETSLLSTCICKLLSENFKLGYSSFVLAIVHEPGQGAELTAHQSFRQGYGQLLEHCDTVILNTDQQIRQQLKQSQSTLDNYLTQSFEANYQTIRSITDLVMYRGLVCFDFADIASIFVNRREAICAMGRGRAFQAITCALNELQGQWGSLSNLDIGGVLINIAASDMSLSEFGVVAGAIHEHEQVSESTIFKIGTSFDNSIPDDEMKVTVIFVKDKTDNLSSGSQYRNQVEEQPF